MRRIRSNAANTHTTRRIGSIDLRAYPAPPGPQVPATVLTNELFSSTLDARTENRRRFGRSLSMDRIESALRAAYRGSMRDITDILHETIDTDPHLGSILNKRFGALSALPYEVQPASGAGIDRKKAMFYAEVVRQQLWNMKSFRRNVGQLAWALFDGRACLEIKWVELALGTGPADPAYGQPALGVQTMEWIHPRRLSFGPKRELRIQPEQVMISGNFPTAGLAVAELPDKFVWWLPQLFNEYPEREGLGMRCMYWSFFKRFAARERMVLTELYGKPWRIIEVDEESSAGSDELKDADRIVDSLGGSYTARLPRGTKLNVVSPTRNAGQVHQEVIDQADQQNSKLVLGQTGTTDGVPSGMNTNQASVMQNEQLGVLLRDAGQLSEQIETMLTDRIIAINFGEAEVTHAPVFRLRADLPANRNLELDRLQKALTAGLSIQRNEAYEISGFSIPEDEDVVIRIEQPPTEPNSPVAPAPRAVVVYPTGATPSVGQQQPNAPVAGADTNAPTPRGFPVSAPDAKHTITVNEDRASRGLGPLKTVDGQPDERGSMTVSEFQAKLEENKGIEQGATKEPLSNLPDPPALGLSRGGVALGNVADDIADGDELYGESGIHAHEVLRAMETTALDGRHVHVFKLDNGTYVTTQLDGLHMHGLVDMDADNTMNDGEHDHAILVNGVGLVTGSDTSAHMHTLQVDATAVDGSHRHTLEVADPNDPTRYKTYRSMSAAELAADQRAGLVPNQVGQLVPPVPSALTGQPVLMGLDARASYALQLSAANIERDLAEWKAWCIAGSEHVALEGFRTTNGAPDDYVDKGMKELTTQTQAWSDHFQAAVRNETTAGGIHTALLRGRNTLNVDKFGRALERRKTQSLMLGVLDSVLDTTGLSEAAIEEKTPGIADQTGDVLKALGLSRASWFTLAKPVDTFTKMPFNTAVQHFKSLGVLDKPTFEKASAAIKARSFTVAGVMADQMLGVLQADLVNAIKNGDDLDDYHKRINARLADAGFVQKLGVLKTGEAALNPSHVETVFRTNVMNTYNTGRFVHASSPSVLAMFPVWELRAIKDSTTRDAHGDADGTMLLASDPFFKTAYPPYGFRCRCRVIPRSKAFLDSVVDGSSVSGLPDAGFTSGRPALALG